MHFIYLHLRPLSINLMPLDCGRQHREAQWYTGRFQSCCEGTMLTSAISCFPWCRWYIPGLTLRGIQSRNHTSPPVSSLSLPVNLTGLSLDCGRRVLWGGNSYQSELNKRQFWLFLFFYAYYQYCNYADKVLEPICDQYRVRSALASSCRRTKDTTACRIRKSHIWKLLVISDCFLETTVPTIKLWLKGCP